MVWHGRLTVGVMMVDSLDLTDGGESSSRQTKGYDSCYRYDANVKGPKTNMNYYW